MAYTIKQNEPKIFSKYEFVKSYMATAKDEKIKIEKEQEALIIADAIEESQNSILQEVATKKDLKILDQDLRSEMKDLRSEIKDVRSEIKILDISLRGEMKSIRGEIKSLEYRLIIRLTAIMAALMTFLPTMTTYLKNLFNI